MVASHFPRNLDWLSALATYEQVGWSKPDFKYIHDHKWDDPEWRSPAGAIVTTRLIHEHAKCVPVFRLASLSDRGDRPWVGRVCLRTSGGSETSL